MLWAGFSLYSSVVDRHVDGFPTTVQTISTLGLPGGILAIDLLALVLARRIPMPAIIWLCLLQLPIALFNIMWVGGGV